MAIASALFTEKEILIFDEPISGLDYKHMLQVANNLEDLKKRGKSIFVISHDLELIYKSCTYIMIMKDGKVENKFKMNRQGQTFLKEFYM